MAVGHATRTHPRPYPKLFSPFPIVNSKFPVPCSLFPVPYSQKLSILFFFLIIVLSE
ncbi:MAG: hypothetical protein F6K65_39825 [Moorea sp. SIO3C2]|nr:hypothetical protein [Moorena sp. SIO3C2]